MESLPTWTIHPFLPTLRFSQERRIPFRDKINQCCVKRLKMEVGVECRNSSINNWTHWQVDHHPLKGNSKQPRVLEPHFNLKTDLIFLMPLIHVDPPDLKKKTPYFWRIFFSGLEDLYPLAFLNHSCLSLFGWFSLEFTLKSTNVTWYWKLTFRGGHNYPVGRVLTLHMVDLRMIPGDPESPLILLRNDFWTQSQKALSTTKNNPKIKTSKLKTHFTILSKIKKCLSKLSCQGYSPKILGFWPR